MLPAPVDTDPTGVEASAKKRRRLGVMFWLSIGWVVLIIFLAVFAGVLPLPDPNAQRAAINLNPSIHHLLGTDSLGRDMLSRVIYASRVSLTVGFASIFLGLLVGGSMGVIAGYYRGRVDRLLMGIADVMLAFPALVFALAIVTFLGQNLRNVTIAIAVISIAPIARIVRASTLTFAQREFVTAARTLGATNWRIIVREILPNVAIPVASFSFIAVALAIVGEGGLAFLGLSVHAPTPTWGGMINDGRSFLQDHPNLSLIPSTVLFVTVLALNFAGDALRARFDTKDVSV
ncbi:MAG TPA: ABC transporter permease [Acidimicrobiales bacterium]|nr:ABC transporter permease [Acidimicrobiales bacterium]